MIIPPCVLRRRRTSRNTPRRGVGHIPIASDSRMSVCPGPPLLVAKKQDHTFGLIQKYAKAQGPSSVISGVSCAIDNRCKNSSLWRLQTACAAEGSCQSHKQPRRETAQGPLNHQCSDIIMAVLRLCGQPDMRRKTDEMSMKLPNQAKTSAPFYPYKKSNGADRRESFGAAVSWTFQ